MGYITPEITGKLPYYLSPPAGLRAADGLNGLAASPKEPAAGWGQILGHMAFRDTSQDQPPGTAASKGAFGFKALTSSDPAAKTAMLTAESTHDGLATIAIVSVFFPSGVGSL
eukprot:3294511-Heterocapsa_arctica.AAC.1